MKFWLINFLAIVLGVISFHGGPSLALDYSDINKIEAIRSVPLLEIDPITTVTTKFSYQEFNYIAQGFIPIVELAESLVDRIPFLHYSSVYDLYRTKEFFLLI